MASSFRSQKSLEHYPLSVKILRINDEHKILRFHASPHDQPARALKKFYVDCRLIVDGKDFVPMRQTKVIEQVGTNIDEIVHFALEFGDKIYSLYPFLPYTTILAFSIWSFDQESLGTPIGSTIISLYDEYLKIRQGKCTLVIWPDTEPDISFDSTTPGIVNDHNINDLQDYFKRQTQEFDENSNTFLHGKAIEGANNKVSYIYKRIPIAFLEIEFVRILAEPIPFEDPFKVSDCFSGHEFVVLKNRLLNNPNDCFGINLFYKDNKEIPHGDVLVCRDYDNDLGREDPVKVQYNKILRHEAHPEEMRPSMVEITKINAILNFPNFRRLDEDEKNLIWKFRYNLKDKGNALPKFLNAVNWNEESEVKEALKMLDLWEIPHIDDGLYLLSRDFKCNDFYSDDLTFKNRIKRPKDKMQTIRKYAVEKILANEKAYDKLPFGLVLLQLVQALRYESFSEENSALKNFLLDRCSTDITLATQLFWFLNVEHEKEPNAKNESESSQWYARVSNEFAAKLERSQPDFWEDISNQITTRNKLKELNRLIKQFDTTERQKEEMRKLLRSDPFYSSPPFVGHRLSTQPNLKVVKVIPEECTIFKSAIKPFRISFVVRETAQDGTMVGPEKKYSVMFKNGDDLRQDQLVIQMVMVMDTLLKIISTNLSLTPYAAIAFSKFDGMLEFVSNSDTLQNYSKKYTNFLTFFDETARQTYLNNRSRAQTNTLSTLLSFNSSLNCPFHVVFCSPHFPIVFVLLSSFPCCLCPELLCCQLITHLCLDLFMCVCVDSPLKEIKQKSAQKTQKSKMKIIMIFLIRFWS